MQALPIGLKIGNLHLNRGHVRGGPKIHHGVHEAALLGQRQSFYLQQ